MLVRTSAAEAQGRLRQIIEDFRTRWPNAHGLISRLWDLQQEEQADYRFLRASLQLYLSSYLLWPRKLAERVIALTQYASRVRAGRARQYLSRVSRCYLYGMVPELAVMARAALHAVLEDCIEEEQVRRIQDVPKHRRVGLADYIEVARDTLLSEDATESAGKVKDFGDAAAHYSPETVASADEILEHLVVVLNAIGDRRPG